MMPSHASAHECGVAEAQVAETIRAALGDARRIVAPDDLPYPVDDALTDDFSPSELDTVDAVVTAAAVGIAVTGTTVLDHGPGPGPPRAQPGARPARLRRPGGPDRRRGAGGRRAARSAPAADVDQRPVGHQ